MKKKKFLQTPFAYRGSKQRLLPKILPHLQKTKVLVEPFVGGGAVFIAANYKHTIINDLDPRIYAFWKGVLRADKDDYDYHHFLTAYMLDSLTPLQHKVMNSRESSSAKPESWVALVLSRHGYQGTLVKGSHRGRFIDESDPLGWIRVPDDPDYKSRVCFRSTLNKMKTVRQTFRGRVTVFNRDYADLPIPRDSFIYADPPYAGLRLYDFNFDEADHRRFAAWIRSQTVPWAVSYNIHPLVDELFAGCRFLVLDHFSNIAREKRPEYLILPG